MKIFTSFVVPVLLGYAVGLYTARNRLSFKAGLAIAALTGAVYSLTKYVLTY